MNLNLRSTNTSETQVPAEITYTTVVKRYEKLILGGRKKIATRSLAFLGEILIILLGKEIVMTVTDKEDTAGNISIGIL